MEDGDEPVEFVLWGLLVKEDKKYIVISTWSYADRVYREDNEKIFTIVRSAITSLRELT